MTIGNVKLANNVFLAPLAGISDRSFRQICREQGCGLTYSEMISGKSIQYNNFKQLLDMSETERPWAVQLFGREPDILAEAAQRLDDLCSGGVDIIDINMGCPAPKIVKNGEGSALMREPMLVGEIVEAVVNATNKPVTVKIRKGFTAATPNAPEIAKIAQESGASAITVHGRTREQFYSGHADWDIIAAVKQEVSIPVIGNGDIVSPETAKKILEHTKCDGIMVARGSFGNPWIFSQIIDALDNKNEWTQPSWTQKIEMALKHGRMAISHKGEHVGVMEMRKHLAWYIKGMPNATKLRLLINQATTYSAMEDILRHNNADIL